MNEFDVRPYTNASGGTHRVNIVRRTSRYSQTCWSLTIDQAYKLYTQLGTVLEKETPDPLITECLETRRAREQEAGVG